MSKSYLSSERLHRRENGYAMPLRSGQGQSRRLKRARGTSKGTLRERGDFSARADFAAGLSAAAFIELFRGQFEAGERVDRARVELAAHDQSQKNAAPSGQGR